MATSSGKSSGQGGTKKSWFRRMVFVGTLFGIAVAFIGWRIALGLAHRRVLEQIQGAITEGHVDVQAVALRPNGLLISEIAITNSTESNPWLQVESVFLKAPVWTLISEPPTFHAVIVNRPHLQLQFDEQGKLRLPLSWDNTQTPTIDVLEFHEASVDIRQGAKRLQANEIQVRMRLLEDNEEMEGIIGNLADTPWEIKGRRIEDGFSASISTESLKIDSDAAANWPLVAQSLPSQTPFRATAQIGLSLVVRTIDSYEIALDSKLTELAIDKKLVPIESVHGNLKRKMDQVDLSGLQIGFSAGIVTGQGNATRKDGHWTGRISAEVDDIHASDFQSFLSFSEPLQGRIQGSAEANFDLTSDSLSVSGKSVGSVFDASIRGIQIASTPFHIQLDSVSLRYDEQGMSELRGTLTCDHFNLKQVSVSRILDQFPDAQSWKHQVSGELTASGSITVPLESMEDLSTWEGSIRGSLQDVNAFKIRMSELSADIQLSEQGVTLPNITADFVEGGTLSGSVRGDLQDDSAFTLQLTGNQIATANFRSLLAITADQDRQHPLNQSTGSFNFECEAKFPWKTISDLEQWRVDGRLHSDECDFGDQRLTDFSGDFSLRDAALRLKPSVAKVHGGRVRFDGRLPLDGSAPSRLNFEFADVDVASVLQSESIGDLPGVQTLRKELNRSGNPACRVNAKGYATVRPEKWRDPMAWTAATTLSTECSGDNDNHVVLSGLVGVQKGNCVMRDLTLRLDSERHLLVSGRFPASLHGECRINLEAAKLPISILSDLVRIGDLPLEGDFFATANIQGAMNARDFSELRGRGNFQVDNVSVVGRGDFFSSSEFRCENGVVFVTPARRQEHQTGLDIEGKLQLADGFPYDFRLHMPTTEVAWANESRNSATAQLSFKSKLSGKLSPPDVAVQGEVVAHSLRHGDQQFGDTVFHFRRAVGSKRITGQGDFLGSSIDAKVELNDQLTRIQTIHLAARSIEIESIIKLLVPQFPLPATGQISSSLEFQYGDSWETSRATYKLTSSDLMIGEEPIDDLVAEVSWQNQSADCELSANLFDGQLKLQGGTNSPARWDDLAIALGIDFSNWQLNRMKSLLPRQAKQESIGGRFEGQMNLNWPAKDDGIIGSGSVGIRSLAWNGEVVSPAVDSKATLFSDSIRFDELAADIAGGKLTGQIDLPWRESRNGTYDLRIRDVSLNHRSVREVARTQNVRGSFNASMSGRIGSRITGSGDFTVRRLTYKNRPFGSIHSPLRCSIRPDRREGELEMQRIAMDFAGGRVVGKASARLGQQLDFKTQLHIARMNTGKAAYGLLGIRNLDQGKLNGTLSLQGRNVRSIRNISGRFQGELLDAQVLRLPVLNDLTSFINAGQIARSRFDSDEIDVQIHHGVISVDALPLHAGNAEVFITGKIQENQRVDLDVAVQTGAVQNDFGLNQIFDSPVASLAAPGADALAKASEYLSDRVIYINVGGTLRRPMFRLRPDRQIVDQLLRYYLPETQLQDPRSFR